MVIVTHEMSFAKEVVDWDVSMEKSKIIEIFQLKHFFRNKKIALNDF